MNMRECDWCGEWYDVEKEGDEHFCSGECKKDSEWDEKVSTQWGAM
jgi:hypothetical protein